MEQSNPAEIIAAIDRYFPGAKLDEPYSVEHNLSGQLRHILDLIECFPVQLLGKGAAERALFGATHSAIADILGRWQSTRDSHHAPGLRMIPGYGSANPITHLRQLMQKSDDTHSNSTGSADGALSHQRRRSNSGGGKGESVFLVHGHNLPLREEVGSFIDRLTGQRPIVLDEQPGASRTIIEKFEQHAGAAAFAVVLITGDDEGRSRQPLAMSSAARAKNFKPKRPLLRPRARQNVILELGYFVGALGRHRVCALYERGVEMPSDYAGVEYVQIDDAATWKAKLAKELRAAGLEVNHQDMPQVS